MALRGAARAAVRGAVRQDARGRSRPPPRGGRRGRGTDATSSWTRGPTSSPGTCWTAGSARRPRRAARSTSAVQAYVGMLAVLKAGAAYVPLDAGFPPDRLAYIVADAGVGVVLTRRTCDRTSPMPAPQVVCLDAVASEIAARDGSRLRTAERGEAVDDSAYIIYTSGSTGRPKGVAVEHASICNFVRVAAEVYGVRPDDRVYQGMTIAFDFSVEEIWVPWMVGATLVPKPRGRQPAGRRAARSSSPSGRSPRCAACRRCSPPSTRTCPTCGSCSSPARRARTTSSRAGTGRTGGSSTSTARPRPP